MLDTIVSDCHLMILCIIGAFGTFEWWLGWKGNIFSQPTEVVWITQMIIQGILVKKKLWAHLAVMCYFINLCNISTHFLSKSTVDYSVRKANMFEQCISISSCERTLGTVEAVGWQSLQQRVSEMVNLMISLVPSFVRVGKFLTTQFTNILWWFGIF